MRTKIFGISPGLYGQPRSYDPIGSESGATSLISVDTDFFSNILQPTITVTAKDINGLRFKIGGATVTLDTNVGPNASLTSVVDNNDGTYTSTLTILNNYEGEIIVSGTIGGEVIVDNVVVTTYSTSASINTSEVTILPTEIISNGTNSVTVTAQLKDGAGNNITVGGENVEFASNGAGAFIGRDPQDAGDGTYFQSYDATDTFVGNVTFTGFIDGNEIVDTAILTQTQPVATTEESIIYALPPEIDADGIDVLPIFLNARDADGIVVGSGGETVVLFVDNGAIVSSVTDEGNGNYSADLTTSTEGTITITATINGNLVDHFASVTASIPTTTEDQQVIASPVGLATGVATDGSNNWVVAGPGGVAYSSDKVNWTLSVSTITGNPESVSSDGLGNWVMSTTAEEIYTSTDNGATWTNRAQIGNISLGHIAYVPTDDIFYVFSTTNGDQMKSLDKGLTWESTPLSGTGYQCFATDGSRLIAGSSSGSTRYTDDGLTWADATGPIFQAFASGDYGNGGFAFSNAGGNIYYHPTGQGSYTIINPDAGNFAAGNMLLWIPNESRWVYSQGDQWYESTDLTAWSEITTGEFFGLNRGVDQAAKADATGYVIADHTGNLIIQGEVPII